MTNQREKVYDHIDVLDAFIRVNPFSERMLNYAKEHRELADVCIADPFDFDAHTKGWCSSMSKDNRTSGMIGFPVPPPEPYGCDGETGFYGVPVEMKKVRLSGFITRLYELQSDYSDVIGVIAGNSLNDTIAEALDSLSNLQEHGE